MSNIQEIALIIEKMRTEIREIEKKYNIEDRCGKYCLYCRKFYEEGENEEEKKCTDENHFVIHIPSDSETQETNIIIKTIEVLIMRCFPLLNITCDEIFRILEI